MFKNFQRIIREEWSIIVPDDLDLSMTLREFSEGLSCQLEGLEITTENIDKVYDIGVSIESESLHMVGCMAFTIIYDLNLDPLKTNANMTLREIFSQKPIKV